ncbi:uncharacterized protein [Palaemon carinicauda]|uniref:uncharacterized protein n=1 Tax=Palaemon carinicauda TaxID=392227 RepID=UPI0035B64BA6
MSERDERERIQEEKDREERRHVKEMEARREDDEREERLRAKEMEAKKEKEEKKIVRQEEKQRKEEGKEMEKVRIPEHTRTYLREGDKKKLEKAASLSNDYNIIRLKPSSGMKFQSSFRQSIKYSQNRGNQFGNNYGHKFNSYNGSSTVTVPKGNGIVP